MLNSESEFYGDSFYKFKKLIGRNVFSLQFRKIITRYRRIGYNLKVMRLVPFYISVLVVVPCGGPKKSPRTSI